MVASVDNSPLIAQLRGQQFVHSVSPIGSPLQKTLASPPLIAQQTPFALPAQITPTSQSLGVSAGSSFGLTNSSQADQNMLSLALLASGNSRTAALAQLLLVSKASSAENQLLALRQATALQALRSTSPTLFAPSLTRSAGANASGASVASDTPSTSSAILAKALPGATLEQQLDLVRLMNARARANTNAASAALTNAFTTANAAPSANAVAAAYLRNQAFMAARLANASFAASQASQTAMGGVMVQHNKKREPVPLFMECDEDSLSEYQCLIRKQIELFDADFEEANSSVQGRNKQVVEGQVGIRCRHCTCIPPRQRQRGCMYFPTKLDRIYQAAQNLSAFHLVEHCKHIPEDVRHKIKVLRLRKSPAGGGKRYWGEGVRCQGVYEDEAGLRFR
mmetsp:Transcript_7818/g.21109  ORF Transcript_7818/g.21109 Transcript_7818/m.21109 type:complete len:395 (-) Transcript_7818:503-1687(-)